MELGLNIVSNLVHKSFGLLCRVFSNYRNEMNADKYQRLDTSNKGALLGLKWSVHRISLMISKIIKKEILN